MRILFVTQWFDPEPNPKGFEFAKALVERGFNVEVVTGFPNYPGGVLYPGYRISIIQREVIGGVEVTRLPLFPSHDQSRIGRVLNYVSFMLSVIFYVLFFAKKPDAAYVYHPPLTVGIAAGLLRLIRGVPFVYDVQDLWPQTLRATKMIKSRLLLSTIAAFCKLVYRLASRIVVLSPGFRDALIASGVPAEKIHVIFNWAGEEALQRQDGKLNEEFACKESFKLVFAGTMGKAQGLENVLEAAKIIAAGPGGVRIFLIGGGVELEGLRIRAHELGLTNVSFLPRVPMTEVGSVLAVADALLVHLRADPLFEITVPSKTQAYMLAGKPIIMAVAGDAADLVSQARCGLIVAPGDVQSLANGIIAMSAKSRAELEALGQNGLVFYRSFLSLNVGVDRFATLFRAVGRPR